MMSHFMPFDTHWTIKLQGNRGCNFLNLYLSPVLSLAPGTQVELSE